MLKVLKTAKSTPSISKFVKPKNEEMDKKVANAELKAAAFMSEQDSIFCSR